MTTLSRGLWWTSVVATGAFSIALAAAMPRWGSAAPDGEDSPLAATIRAASLFDSNSYLLRAGDGFILLDGGVSGRRRAVVEELTAAGCRPGDLRLIVVTHAHADHVGNCAYLREVYGAPIAMHSSDAGKARRGDMFWRPEGLTTGMRVARALTFAVGALRFDPFEPDVLLADGQSLAGYGLRATVHHLPGHSPGSISLLTANGDFFCGDLLTSTRGPQRNTIIDTSSDYDASIDRLRDLPIRTVYPGHGEPFAIEQLLGSR